MMPFTLGLATGGWIADELGWRALLALNIPCALTIAGITAALLRDRPFIPRSERFDLVGFLLLAGGAAVLLPNVPLVKLILWSQILNGAVLPLVLAYMTLLVNKRRLMRSGATRRCKTSRHGARSLL